MNAKPETQNRISEQMGLANHGETHGLTRTGPALAHQGSATLVFGLVRYQTDRFLQSKPGPLAGYLDPLLSVFPSLHPISLSREYQLLEVQWIVSELPQDWIPISNLQFWCVTHCAMGLLDRVQVNVSNVVSCACDDDRITLLHRTVRTIHQLSSVEKCNEKRHHMLENHL